jgi:hypothetical protein
MGASLRWQGGEEELNARGPVIPSASPVVPRTLPVVTNHGKIEGLTVRKQRLSRQPLKVLHEST